MASAWSLRKRLLDDPKEEYRLLMECVTDYAIFLFDREGRVAEWNPGAERIFGFLEAEIVGQPGSLIFTPEDVKRGVPRQELQTAKQEGRAMDERASASTRKSPMRKHSEVTTSWITMVRNLFLRSLP